MRTHLNGEPHEVDSAKIGGVGLAGSGFRHRSVAKSLCARLSAGEWPHGTILPSLRDLAKQYGVGVQVIRVAFKLLQEQGRIELNTRHRAVARYRPLFPSATAGVVALVLGHDLRVQWQNHDFGQIQRGVEEAVGGPLLIVHDPRRYRSLVPPDLLELPLSGILLQGQFQPQVLNEYMRVSKPVVLVDRPGVRHGLASVSVDNRKAAYEATRRLLAKGHRRIGFLRFVQLNLRTIDDDSREREEGYKQALLDSGLKPCSEDIYNTFAKDTEKSAYAKALLSRNSAVTALIACDASRAEVILRAAAAAGKHIPRDLSLVCFQGKSALLPQVSGPRIDFQEIGRRAVALLGYKNGRPHERLDAEWFEARTCASPRKPVF